MTSDRGAGAIPGFILILASLTALAPLATDAYLPAMPTIAAELGRSIHDVELSLSLFLAGFSVGQLIGGPYSDHFGRRAGIFTGLALFCSGSLAIALTQSVEWLWAFRVVQALGGGLTVVNTPAIVRDFYSGRDSARVMSRMAIILMVAPLSAPILGMLILKAGSWQSIFLFLLVYGLLLGVVIFHSLPETRQVQSGRPNALRRYWAVLSHRHSLGYLASACCAYGSLFAFITSSPSVYMEYFGLSESVYPFIFAGNVIAVVLMNRVNIRLLSSHTPQRLLLAGQLMQLVAGALLAGYVLLVTEPSLLLTTLLVVLFFSCHGVLSANNMAGITEFFPTNSATATALMGACGFAFGALTGSLVGVYGDGTPRAMTLVMFGCALLAPIIRSLLQTGSAAAPDMNSSLQRRIS